MVRSKTNSQESATDTAPRGGIDINNGTPVDARIIEYCDNDSVKSKQCEKVAPNKNNGSVSKDGTTCGDEHVQLRGVAASQ